jgi:hypothetical protein
MIEEQASAPVGLINEILPEVIFIRMDQALWKFFRWTPYTRISV